MSVVYDPRQDKRPDFNREPGLAVVPGSNFQMEMAKWEQFPDSKWAFGNPGNPYVKREFPKMLYKAKRHKSGALTAMAPNPDPYGNWRDPNEYQRALEEVSRFNESCQRIVQNDIEYGHAHEDGWRDDPLLAVEHADARERAIADVAAHRNYEDRNMSPMAKREIAAAEAATDGHLAEVPRKRGRPRKNPAA